MSLVFISFFNFAKNFINNFFTNIFALFKKKNKKEFNFNDGEEYYALIEESNGKLIISIIDAETEEEDFAKSFLVNQRYKSPKAFVDALSKIFTKKNFKAVLFNSEFNVYVYKFKENGFQRISSREVSANQRAILIRQEIIGSDNPVRIFATPNLQNQPWKTGLRKIKFKMDGFNFIPLEDIYNTDSPTIEFSKWIINNKRNTKYYILPSCERTSVVFHGCNKKVNAILTAKCNDTLPFNESVVVSRSIGNYYVSFYFLFVPVLLFDAASATRMYSHLLPCFTVPFI
uniref:Uncharacterized protein n=1 Tax=Panagrolaimus sp. PS1159 TaxID=55785 RepID=A0AC35FX18_9BILA